jgi:hypothetical protein
MILFYVLVLFVEITESIHVDDVYADLVHNDSSITEIRSNAIKFFTDYPEDCVAAYMDAKTFNQYVT